MGGYISTYVPINTGSASSLTYPMDDFNYTAATNTVTFYEVGSSPDTKIPDLRETEVGMLRRHVAEVCAEGRVALEAA